MLQRKRFLNYLQRNREHCGLNFLAETGARFASTK